MLPLRKLSMVVAAMILLLGIAPSYAQSVSSINPITAGPATLSAADAGTCTVTNTGCLIVNLGGYAGVGVQLTGTWSGTVTFEVTVDGTTWVSDDLVQTTSTTPVATSTGNGVFVGATIGSKFRVRFSTRSSGSVVASVRATMNVASSGFGTGTNGASGSPAGATYLVQTSDAGLSSAQAMSALGTGLVKNTTTTGVQSIYAGSTCTNQVVTALNASAAATCTTVTSAYVDSSIALAPLIATSASIGGSPLAAGACASGDTAVTGATTAMSVAVSPSADPDPSLSTGVVWAAFVSASDVVTVRVCGLAIVTPTARTYNIRVIR